MKLLIGNVSLEVEEQGAGDLSLVFLHYWGGTHRTWRQVVAHLQSACRLVTYDIRGWGQSAASDDYSIAALADEALALIHHLKLTRYVLVGHSMGGKVAQLVASRQPQGLVGLILVAPATPTPTRLPEEARQQQLHAYDNRETVLQTIAFLTARTPDPATVEQIIEDSLSGTPEAKLAWPSAAILEDISAEVPKISVPTLVLAGEVDRLDSVEQHRREVIARIPGATLAIVPHSGHLLPIDEPIRVAHEIDSFLTSHSLTHATPALSGSGHTGPR
ncbi:Pimeloyl-ACP methyl ester carboxylesterase [Bryocella elongata]|uniref:Pimeloyl-ACP methyl ester carboxylesterase n=1 Tax=Bryocella elongata TaxID=863522 RepID=A0A1H5WUV0_9BACT|nr:alpha/beta hydrolase [Bryocella elongata]SEG03241.1 Pimeloyl-ACP methyl ester carboxylesterase [Bryocella elongata]